MPWPFSKLIGNPDMADALTLTNLRRSLIASRLDPGQLGNVFVVVSTDYAYGSEDGKKASTLGYGQDVIGSNMMTNSAHGGSITTPTTVCYEYSYPDSNSNHSKSGFLRPSSEHHYEQPMVVFPHGHRPVSPNPHLTHDESFVKLHTSNSSKGSEGGSTTTTASSSAALTRPDKGRMIV